MAENELLTSMKKTVKSMHATAILLQDSGDADMTERGEELAGAAGMMASWVIGYEKELGEKVEK